MTPYSFNFDPDKDALNVSKHGLSLKEGEKVFLSPQKLTLMSPRADESRLMDVAVVNRRVMILVYVERVNEIRFISLRYASKQERVLYDQWQNNN